MRIITDTITINASATNSASISLSPNVVLANTWIVYTVKGGNANPNQSMPLYTLTTSSLVFTRQGSASNVITIEYTIISSKIFNVQHFSGNVTVTPTNIALTTINTAQTFSIIYASTGGSSFTEDEILQTTLTSTQLSIICAVTPNTNYRCQIVSCVFFSVQTVTFSLGSGILSQNLTIANVDTTKTFLEVQNISGSSSTTRLNEKCVIAKLTSSTNILVERSGSTTNVSGIIYVISLTGDPTVAHSGDITFTSSASPTSPTGDFAGNSTPFNKTIPWLRCCAPYGYAKNNVTSDDDIGKVEVLAVLNSLSGGNSSSVTLSKTATTDIVKVAVSTIYLPDSFDTTTLDAIGLETEQSLIGLRAKYDLISTGLEYTQSLTVLRANYNCTITGLETGQSLIATRGLFSLAAAGVGNENSLIGLRANFSLLGTGLETEQSLIGLRANYNLLGVGLETEQSSIAARGVLGLLVTGVENPGSLIGLRANFSLSVGAFGQNQTLANIRALLTTGSTGLEYQSSWIEFGLNPNELLIESVQIETSLVGLRAVVPLTVNGLEQEYGLVNLNAQNKLNFVGTTLGRSLIEVFAQDQLHVDSCVMTGAYVQFNSAYYELDCASTVVNGSFIELMASQNAVDISTLETSLITMESNASKMSVDGVLVRTSDVWGSINDYGTGQ